MRKREERILLTGGGTGGHVNPALAIGSALAGENTRFLYVGVRGRAEEVIVPREGLPIRFVRASGFPGLAPLALLRFVFDMAVGTLQAVPILLRFRPHLIVGTGGFASAPVIFAATLLRRLGVIRPRVVLHEQNAVPGKLNQLVGKFVDRVFVTFPETLRSFPGKGVLTGYPLRKRIGAVSREEALAKLDFRIPEGRDVVFVFGGSQGARTLNRAVVDALADLLPHRERLFVVHGVGLVKTAGYDAEADTRARLEARYRPEERGLIDGFYVARPFFHDIERLYAVSTLVVARSGSGSLNELAAVGLPSVLIPKANLPGDHQVMNARAVERAGGALVLYEETVLEDGQIVERLPGRTLADSILALLDDPERRAELGRKSRAFLKQDALQEITRAVRESSKGVVAAAPAMPDAEAEGLPSNGELLSRLEGACRRQGEAYTPESVVADPADLAYFVSRAASLLVSQEWERRNLGVKLLGLLQAREKRPLLLALFHDRRPAPRLKRMLGGDFEQVGFIRRNIVVALARLGEVTPEVEAALLLGLSDPYYEVRCEAALAAARFGARLSRRGEIVGELVRLLDDRNIEVATNAAEALGALGSEADALPPLLSLAGARFWKLRGAALKGLLALVSRGAVSDLTALRRELPRFVLTSTDFSPQFEIKSSYRKLVEAVGTGKGPA